MIRKKKRKQRFRYKPLPPHTWEVHRVHGQGKPMVILAIAIGALLLIGGLTFFSSTFVGKAIHIEGAALNTAGVSIKTTSTVKINEKFQVPIALNIGKVKATTFHAKLTYDKDSLDVDCTHLFDPLHKIFKGVDNTKAFDLTLYSKEIQCKDGVVEYQFSAVPFKDKIITGDMIVGNLTLTPKKEGNLEIKTTQFTVYTDGLPLDLKGPQYSQVKVLGLKTSCAVEAEFTDRYGKKVKRMVDNDKACDAGNICLRGTCVEAVCNDGKDDNGNKAVDCNDIGCFTQKECLAKSCKDATECGAAWACIKGTCQIKATTKASCEKLGFQDTQTIDSTLVCSMKELCESHNPEDLDGDGKPGCQDDECKDAPFCEVAFCGDGIKDTDEQCDEGKNNTNTCSTSYNNDCTYCSNKCITHTLKTQHRCGDGVIDKANETCDDSNVVAGDGCSSSCKIEPASTCTGQPSVCKVHSVCGDGIVQGLEECDDKNKLETDYCDKKCKKTSKACIDDDNTFVNRKSYLQKEPNNVSLTIASKAYFNTTINNDACLLDGKVQEAYCSNTTQVSHDSFECPKGLSCLAGACRDAKNLSCSTKDDLVDNKLWLCDSSGSWKKCVYGASNSTDNRFSCNPGKNEWVKVVAECGDNLIVSPETCDDGNKINGDGCSDVCAIETKIATNQSKVNVSNKNKTMVPPPPKVGSSKIAISVTDLNKTAVDIGFSEKIVNPYFIYITLKDKIGNVFHFSSHRIENVSQVFSIDVPANASNIHQKSVVIQDSLINPQIYNKEIFTKIYNGQN